MAVTAKELENKVIPLYPRIIRKKRNYINTGCDVCEEWEATVKFKNTKLCDTCAREEGIVIL